MGPASQHKGKFIPGWEDCMKQIAIPSQEIKGPSPFCLKLNVPEGKAYDVFVLNCQFWEGGNVESLDPAVFPLVFSRAHGIMQAKRLAGKESLVLSTKADLFEVRAQLFDPAKGIDTSTGEYVFVPNGNLFGEVILSDGSTRAFPDRDLPPCCALLAAALWFYFPDTAHLQVGAKWEIPAGIVAEYARPCEVVGFAHMAGKDTVVISCHVEQQRFRSSKQHVVVIGEAEMKKGSIHVTAPKVVEGTKWRDTFHLTAHLDLETGLPVRQEVRQRVELQMPDSSVSSTMEFHVSRILDA